MVLVVQQFLQAGQSVLSSGRWYKFSVTASGVYRLNYDDLSAIGIDLSDTDPRNIRIYGNGGRMLSESLSQPRPDDLLENAVLIVGEDDGVFDPEDYILFYAEGPVSWNYSPFYQKFEHHVNLYSRKAYYFLTVAENPGKRIAAAVPPTGDPTAVITRFNDFACHELDSVNLIKSGKEWYGEVFSNVTERAYTFSFPYIDTAEAAYFKSNVVARSTESSTFSFYFGEELLEEQELASIEIGSSVYARTMTTRIKPFMPKDSSIILRVVYDKPVQTSVGWMNYIEINAVSRLVYGGGQLDFRDVASVGPGNVAQFNFSSGRDFVVWDITDPSNIVQPSLFAISGGRAFKAAADTLREYLAFDASSFFSPAFEEEVPNQDLHSLSPANMVIVVHPSFMTEALRLADFHRQYSRLTVNVVTPQLIYNEFSSGAQDVTAIRDFMKMLYDRNDADSELRYLLLFGDASYDYLGRLPDDDNLVPTFQSMESLKTASSFVTDDYFGCLDWGEGSNASGTVDIGIGRFPVRTLDESRALVDKVIRYAQGVPQVSGDWRNKIFLVADDEDNNIHLDQAEELGMIIDSVAPGFNIDKIYLDAYLQQSSPNGARYPDVSKAIDKAVQDGAFIINYTGHGGETGWAHEKVVDMSMITSWDNHDMLPAFVTATCEFSRFDDPGLVSAGEWVILNPKGGGIGLFTTSRLAYSQSNAALNQRLYKAAFERDSITGEYPRMGDLMKHAKTPSSQNIKNFVLLGDPALSLAYPFLNVKTTGIVNDLTGEPADTLKALSTVTVSGIIEDIRGNHVSSFQGRVAPVVYDKPVTYQTRGNDHTSKETEFLIQNKVLFKGDVTVTDGTFSFTFLVPRDISYLYGAGKISYYALDTVTFTDAQGLTPVIVGGADPNPEADDTGPQISLYLNDTTFISGDLTTVSPLLIAHLSDESGINAVGNGIGHDITATIDGNSQTTVILNGYYSPDANTYRSGVIEFPLGTMAPGMHTLRLKAWDLYNNSSEAEIMFMIDTVSPVSLRDAYNYPNPFREGTTFVFTHNKPGSMLDVGIEIFSLDGRLVRGLSYSFTSENLQSEPYYWNGRSSDGGALPAGLYLYRLKAASGSGNYSILSRKLMIVR